MFEEAKIVCVQENELTTIPQGILRVRDSRGTHAANAVLRDVLLLLGDRSFCLVAHVRAAQVAPAL